MSNCTPSPFTNSKRFASRMSTTRARFVDAQTGASASIGDDLARAAAELLGMSNATCLDEDHHLLYVSADRILHVAYAEAHDRVCGPPDHCDDETYTSWWTRHRAWRRGVVNAARYSSNAEETAQFFAQDREFSSAENHYLKQHGAPATSAHADANPCVSNPETAVEAKNGRVRLLCPSCKSADVLRDAYAKWSFEDQAWVLAEVFDFMVCEACEEEASDLHVVDEDADA